MAQVRLKLCFLTQQGAMTPACQILILFNSTLVVDGIFIPVFHVQNKGCKFEGGSGSAPQRNCCKIHVFSSIQNVSFHVLLTYRSNLQTFVRSFPDLTCLVVNLVTINSLISQNCPCDLYFTVTLCSSSINKHTM